MKKAVSNLVTPYRPVGVSQLLHSYTTRSTPDSSNVSLKAQIRKATSPGIGEPSFSRSVANIGVKRRNQSRTRAADVTVRSCPAENRGRLSPVSLPINSLHRACGLRLK
ncbi:hypothetical protein FQN60_010757 [Etheostoma spectabile]|uniref:Uncharacterized protein n=1 Tax=Etheostoma spectabile TaxID=54343 RepID=A0A5J5DQ40_9PERO|nr:hypothetical protein FQN60_010757 [Etheostoma spectabile]